MTKTITRKSQTLQTSNFVLSANQLSYLSPVATYTVPQSQVLEIPNSFIGLKLMTKESHSFSTGSGVTTYSITTNFPIAVDPSITLVGQNVVVVITTPATGAVTTFTVTTPNTVALTGLTQNTSYVVTVYYYPIGGSATLTVTSSDGTATTPILTKSLMTLAYTNDDDVRQGLKPAMVGLVIPERYQIQLQINSPAPIVLYGTTETAYSSPYASQSFISLPVQISSIFDWPDGIKGYAKGQLMGV